MFIFCELWDNHSVALPTLHAASKWQFANSARVICNFLFWICTRLVLDLLLYGRKSGVLVPPLFPCIHCQGKQYRWVETLALNPIV